VDALVGRSSPPARTVPDLARRWFEAQAKDGLFSPKLDRALLKVPATSVADVDALLEVVIHEYTVMRSDYEGNIGGFGDAGQELMWKAINDAHRLLARPKATLVTAR
jgi:hypothetical protein